MISIVFPFFRLSLAGAVLAVLTACLATFGGCKNTGKERTSAERAEAVYEPGSESSRSPYYYGLIEEYRTILSQDRDNLAVITALGNAYFESSMWQEAITMYQRALALNPRNADVHASLGTAYRNMGKTQRGLAEYHRALALDPGNTDARYNMGLLYANNVRSYRTAIRIWEDLLLLSPNDRRVDRIRERIALMRQELKKEGK